LTTASDFAYLAFAIIMPKKFSKPHGRDYVLENDTSQKIQLYKKAILNAHQPSFFIPFKLEKKSTTV